MYGRFRVRLVRKRRKKKKDDGQSSLDAFARGSAPQGEEGDDLPIPSMVDLDQLEAAQHSLEEASVGASTEEEMGPRSFNMPSLRGKTKPHAVKGNGTKFHDLDQLYPSAPVPLEGGGMVIHYATLNDITGCNQVLDWIADGHAAIVEMQRLMNRTTEFNQALSTLQGLVEEDIGGRIVKMTDSRLMCLPEGCRGVRGTEMEAFAAGDHDFSDVIS